MTTTAQAVLDLLNGDKDRFWAANEVVNAVYAEARDTRKALHTLVRSSLIHHNRRALGRNIDAYRAR